jgi:hypothetical protein
MASKKKSSSKEVPPIVLEAIESIVQKYDVSAVFQKIIEEQATTALGSKKPSKKSNLIGIAKDVLNKSTKSKLEDSPAAAQVQPLQGLNNNKIKSLLQGLMGLGTLLKSSANITSAKSAPVTESNTPPLPTTATVTPTVTPVKVPTKREEKDLIKDKEPQVVLLGGITNEGIGDLQKKLPVVLKDVLDELKKGLKDIKLPEIKQPAAAASSGGGGLLDSLLDGGILGTAFDFFKKKKGTAGGRISRNQKAKQLRAERAARKAETGSTLKTAEKGTPERANKAKELKAERAARKAETGSTLKTAENTTAKGAESTAAKKVSSTAAKKVSSTAARGAGKAVAKGTGKAVAKGAGKAILKSGLKKIPILGAVAGLGFGAQRALAGDWLGAAGEVASGAAGSIPGLGTLASTGIDAALAARDISKEVNQPEATSDEIQEAVPTQTVPSETIQPFKEGNQDLKPIGEVPSSVVPSSSGAESNPNKDILNKIAENTGSTNSSIGNLTQAIYKLAQSMGGKTGSPPPIIVNGGQQKQDSGPSASQVAAANNDPIRNVRAQFAL